MSIDQAKYCGSNTRTNGWRTSQNKFQKLSEKTKNVLTSSISSRETFLLFSLFGTDAPSESAIRASGPGLICGLLCELGDACDDCFTSSLVPWGSYTFFKKNLNPTSTTAMKYSITKWLTKKIKRGAVPYASAYIWYCKPKLKSNKTPIKHKFGPENVKIKIWWTIL